MGNSQSKDVFTTLCDMRWIHLICVGVSHLQSVFDFEGNFRLIDHGLCVSLRWTALACKLRMRWIHSTCDGVSHLQIVFSFQSNFRFIDRGLCVSLRRIALACKLMNNFSWERSRKTIERTDPKEETSMYPLWSRQNVNHNMRQNLL